LQPALSPTGRSSNFAG